MKKIIVGSVSENAGKTSLIIGLAKAIDKKFGYLKPFGDRLIYRKKRLWDYDAALLTNIFGLQQSSDEMTVGFEHAKLRYMYDEASTEAKVNDMVNHLNSDFLFIEGGGKLTYGASVRLDTISCARYSGGMVLFVVSGDEGTIFDEITFLKKYVDLTGIDYGVVINKVNNLDDFKNSYLPDIEQTGINIFGIIPCMPDLTYPSMSYLAEKLQARIIAGESGMKNKIKTKVIASKSADSVLRDPKFVLGGKLIIASGDRSDHLASALVVPPAGIIITNNILPAPYILAKLTEMNTPVLMVPHDTFETAKLIDDAIPLVTSDDTENIELLKKLIEQNVNIKSIL